MPQSTASTGVIPKVRTPWALKAGSGCRAHFDTALTPAASGSPIARSRMSNQPRPSPPEHRSADRAWVRQASCVGRSGRAASDVEHQRGALDGVQICRSFSASLTCWVKMSVCAVRPFTVTGSWTAKNQNGQRGQAMPAQIEPNAAQGTRAATCTAARQGQREQVPRPACSEPRVRMQPDPSADLPRPRRTMPAAYRAARARMQASPQGKAKWDEPSREKLMCQRMNASSKPAPGTASRTAPSEQIGDGDGQRTNDCRRCPRGQMLSPRGGDRPEMR